MLKLVHALDMSFENVLSYVIDFENDWNDLNNNALQVSQFGMSKYLEKINSQDNHLFYLIDDVNPSYIIGFGNIEDSRILDYHREYLNVGNISYGVRPCERKKGYGTTILKLLLEECKLLGMKDVCISCSIKNDASRRIIEKNNGKLKKSWYDEFTGDTCLKYFIKFSPSIKNMSRRLVRLCKINF